MTAAHCCVGQVASDVRVVAGDHNLEADEGTEQVSLTIDIYVAVP